MLLYLATLENMSSKTDKLKKLGLVSQYESKDKAYGERGTEKRESYEDELRFDIMGEFLKSLRTKNKLTQEKIAFLMGLKDRTYVSKIESDSNELRLSTLHKYAKALNARKLSITIEMEDGSPEELVLI